MASLPPIVVRAYGSAADDNPSTTVAALHGGPGAPGMLAGLCEDLVAAAGDASLRVLEPLQRSAADAAGRPLTVALHIADLAAVLPERPVAVLGHSWGAMLALAFAAAHPERVSQLLLVGSGTFDAASREEYQRRMAAALGADGRAAKAGLKARIAALPEADAAGRDALFAEVAALNVAAQRYEPIDRPEPAFVLDREGHAQTWADVLRRQADGTDPACFAGYPGPVALLHGEQDPHPGERIAASLRPYLPQIRYEQLPRCGHEPWLEVHAREPFLAWLLRQIAAGS